MPNTSPTVSKLSRLSLPVLIALALAGCSSASDTELVQRAQDAYLKGDLRSSTIELKNALQKNPNNAQARLLLGRIYTDAGSGADAEKELARATELGIDQNLVLVSRTKALLLQGKLQEVLAATEIIPPLGKAERATLLALRGYAFLGQDSADAANAAFDESLSIHPSLDQAQLGKARVAARLGRRDEVQAWLDKALAANPDDVSALEFAGDLALAENDAAKAEASFSKALAKAPTNTGLLTKRALLRVGTDDLEGAGKDVAELKKLAPKLPLVSYVDGVYLLAKGDVGGAQTALEVALAAAPDDPRIMFFLGSAYFAQDRNELAERHLESFASRVPGSAAAARMLATLRIRRNDYAGASTLLKPLVDAETLDPALLNLMAAALMGQGKLDDGIAYLARAAEIEPDSAAARMRLGLAQLDAGNRAQALESLEGAVDKDPKLTQADIGLVIAHLRAREFDKAIAAAEEFRARQPGSPVPDTLIALAQIGKKDSAAARASLQRALEIAPGDPGASLRLAGLAVADQQYEEARSVLAAALAKHPKHGRVLLTLAALDVRDKKLADAKGRLTTAIEANPDDLQARLALARLQTATGEAERAKGLLLQIRGKSTDNPLVLMELGNAQLALNEDDSAIVTFRRLAEVQPKSANAHYLVARAYAEKNDVEGVRAALGKALALDPNHHASKVVLARLRVMEGKLDEAAPLIAELKKSEPENVDVLTLEGLLALRQGRPQDAVAAYAAAQKVSPSSGRTIALAAVQWRVKDTQGGFDTLRNWLKEHPEDSRAAFTLAQAYQSAGEQDAAIAEYRKVLERSPNNAIVLNNLAWELRDKDPKEALELAQRAVQAAPDSAPVMDTVGLLLLKSGDTAKAVTMLTNAVSKAPNSPLLGFHLAQALAASGDKAKAVAILEKLTDEKVKFKEKPEAEALLEELKAK